MKSSEQDPTQAGSFEGSDSKRILFVDDESALLHLFDKIFGRELQVVTASTAEDALALVREGQVFDAIIVDLHLPGMGGRGLLNQLIALHPALGHRVAFISGDTDGPESRAFLTSIPNLHLGKPFELEHLRSFVCDVLRRASRVDASAAVFPASVPRASL